MRLLLIGGNGLVGTAFQQVAGADPRVSEVAVPGRTQADVADRQAVERVVRAARPDAVVNAAALMPADRCEQEPDLAYAVNALGARWVSHACAGIGARCVYLSSDYVFDGSAGTPYPETALPAPLLSYGVTKLAGEHETLLGGARHLVVRTGGLFGPPPRSPRSRPCLVDRILDQAANGEQTRLVDDVVMSPTYTRDLVAAVLELLLQDAAGGTYHVVNQGHASWYELCCEAAAAAGLRPLPERAGPGERYTTAPRPAYAPLASDRMPAGAGAAGRHWRDALRAYLRDSGRLGD